MNIIPYIFFGITLLAVFYIIKSWVNKKSRNALHEMMKEYIEQNKDYYNL